MVLVANESCICTIACQSVQSIRALAVFDDIVCLQKRPGRPKRRPATWADKLQAALKASLPVGTTFMSLLILFLLATAAFTALGLAVRHRHQLGDTVKAATCDPGSHTAPARCLTSCLLTLPPARHGPAAAARSATGARNTARGFCEPLVCWLCRHKADEALQYSWDTLQRAGTGAWHTTQHQLQQLWVSSPGSLP